MGHFLRKGFMKLVESNLRNTNQARSYARWSHRRPRRVIAPEEYNKIESKYAKSSNVEVEKQSYVSDKIIELNHDEDLIQKQPKLKRTEAKHKAWIPRSLDSQGLVNIDELDAKSREVRPKIEQKVSKRKKLTYKTTNDVSKLQTTDMLETVIDVNGEFIYTKLKDNDPAVGQLLLTVKSRREQIKKDLALLEGKRLIKEALEAGCILKSLIFSRKNDAEYLKPYLPKCGAKLYKMPYKEIQLWSDLTTTPGIMGIFETPDVENFVPKTSLPLTIICDNIREPGNLGAILRTVAGVGAQSVILTKGCVDLWDTKVLRSACGAHFYLQIHRKMNWEDIEKFLNSRRTTVFIADNKIVSASSPNEEKSNKILSNLKLNSLSNIMTSMPLLPYYGVKFDSSMHSVLILGGETEGISEECYRLASNFDGVRLNIPLSNKIDSLNTGTASGIILFEIKRQMALLQSRIEIEASG